MQREVSYRLPFPPLALRLAIQPDETTASFVSRLAAWNGFSNTDTMCAAYGTSFRAVVNGEIGALTRMSEVGAVPLARLQEFVLTVGPATWKGLPIVLAPHQAGILRFCPDCIANDIEANPDLPIHVAAYGRWQWLFKSICACRKHQRLLHAIPRASNALQDFSCLMLDFLSYPHCEPSPPRKYWRQILKPTSKASSAV